MPTKIVVEAPASSANLGAGFDVFALALGRPADRLALVKTDRGVSLSVEGKIPTPVRNNVVEAVAKAMIKGEGVRQGVSLVLRKGIPVGAGLGSSAASSAAAAAGMDSLFGLKLSPAKLVRYAGVGERAASGAAHYDNVAAAIAGGFVIVWEGQHFTMMKPPQDLALCLVVPDVRLPARKTEYARSLLPDSLSLKEAVVVVGSASLMVHGMAHGSVEEIGEAMGGGFVDIRRSAMIPGYDRVKKAAMGSGAAGVCISGAGPAMLAVTKRNRARKVQNAMVGAFRDSGVSSEGFVTRPGRGCRVIARE